MLREIENGLPRTKTRVITNGIVFIPQYKIGSGWYDIRPLSEPFKTREEARLCADNFADEIYRQKKWAQEHPWREVNQDHEAECFKAFSYAVFLMAAILLFLLFSSKQAKADEWTKEDTYREAAYLALHVADWGQTLYIADHPEYHEHNPFLGSNPSRGDVNLYFAISAVLHPAISYILPRPYREIWQYSTIGIEIYMVGNNASLGIKMGF